ncbi:hypothetical protein GCM10017687_20960 [Streptomyces echinatus]
MRRDVGATYASIPMTDLTFSKPLAACWNSYAPNMLPWSLIARVLLLWGRRPADPNRWHSSAGPETLLKVRALLGGY